MASETDSNEAPRQRTRWIKAMWKAFKNFAIIFSFTVNLVIVVVLLLVVGWGLSPLKTGVIEPLLDNLQTAVTALETATIVRTLPIDEKVPVNFVLPVKKQLRSFCLKRWNWYGRPRFFCLMVAVP